MSIHLHIDGVPGESADANHPDWIDVLDLTWGVRRRIPSHSSTRLDRESANAEITDLTLARFVDAATPYLFLEACCGRGKEMTIELTKTGDGTGSHTFMAYRLKNALISKYRVEHAALRTSKIISNPRPVEIITVSFVGIETRYTPYDDSGKPTAPIAVGFDTSTNTKI